MSRMMEEKMEQQNTNEDYVYPINYDVRSNGVGELTEENA
jgi:hypothetical protein